MELTLYHSVESTCAQKVRLVLAEKGLHWHERRLNLRRGDQFDPQYLRLNPRAVVPTLVHGAQVLRESTIINEYLDDAFPEPPLRPAAAAERAGMRLTIRIIDEEVHPAVGFVTYAVVLRRQMNARKSAAELDAHFARVADPMRRERQRLAHERGLEAPQAPAAFQALARFVAHLDELLGSGPWLAGARYSLADAAALPYVVRLRALHMDPLWAGRPRVGDWLARGCGRANCTRAGDPWGPADFLAMFARHADAARDRIAALSAAAAPG